MYVVCLSNVNGFNVGHFMLFAPGPPILMYFFADFLHTCVLHIFWLLLHCANDLEFVLKSY